MTTSVKHYYPRASDLRPQWHLIDAENQTLGRLSSEIALLLQGKRKPIFTRHVNTGDFVVVVNAGKVRVTGRKMSQKLYRRHSGYHGGLREETLAKVLVKSPTRVIFEAVRGMLPKSRLGRVMLSRLKLYAGSTHPHEAQVRGAIRASEKAVAPTTTVRRRTATDRKKTAVAEAPPIKLAKPRRTLTTKGKRQPGERAAIAAPQASRKPEPKVEAPAERSGAVSSPATAPDASTPTKEG